MSTDLRPQLCRLFLFCRIAQRRSLAAAARDLGLSRSVVSEALTELEDEVGVRLAERTTRRLELTQAGEALFARCEQMVAEAELGLDETRGASARAVGTLRVSCTTALVEPLVAPVLADLARRHSLRADVLVDDRRRDLIGDGIDVGVRIGVPREAGFMLRQLGRLPEVLVARADLVAGMDLDDVETLRRLPWIAHAVTPSVLEVRDRRGQSRTIRLTPNLQTDCGIGQRALLLSGGGASLAILSLVAEDLAARRLVELLPGQLSLDAQVFLLLPSIRHLPARTRLFMDTVARRAPGVLARMHAARGQPRA